MITSPQINDELIRRVKAIRARPDFVHPLEGFRVARGRVNWLGWKAVA